MIGSAITPSLREGEWKADVDKFAGEPIDVCWNCNHLYNEPGRQNQKSCPKPWIKGLMNLTPRPYWFWKLRCIEAPNCGLVIRCGQLMSEHCAVGAGGSVAVFNQHVGVDPTIKWRRQVICFKIVTKGPRLIQASMRILLFLSFFLIIPFTYF